MVTRTDTENQTSDERLRSGFSVGLVMSWLCTSYSITRINVCFEVIIKIRLPNLFSEYKDQVRYTLLQKCSQADVEVIVTNSLTKHMSNDAVLLLTNDLLLKMGRH